MPRERGAAWLVLGVIILMLLSQALDAVWASGGSTHDTVPRETPTRRLSPTPSPTGTAQPVFSPTPSLTPTRLPSPTIMAPPTPTPALPSLPTATVTPAPTRTPAVTASVPTITVTPTVKLAVTPSPAATGTLPSVASPSATPVATQLATPSLVTHLPTPGAACQPEPGETTSLRWTDEGVIIDLPAGIVSPSLCLYLGLLSPATLPPPPSGYRFGSLAARLRVASRSSEPAGTVSFAQPYTVALRYEPADVSASGSEYPLIGYLERPGAGWVILEVEHDRVSSLVRGFPQRPGIFVLLVHEEAGGKSEIARQGLAHKLSQLAVPVMWLCLLLGLAVVCRRHVRPA